MSLDAFGTRLTVGTTVVFFLGGRSCAPVRGEVVDFRGDQVRVTITALPRTGSPNLAARLGASMWLCPEELAVLEQPTRMHVTDFQRHDLALGGYPPGVGR